MNDARSSFFYGYKITAQPYNGYININEGAGEVIIQVPVGSYTFTTLVVAVRNALLSQGSLEYTVTANRDGRTFTIGADATFDLLLSSGSNSGSALWPLLGFDESADKTGLLSYTSDFAAGVEYKPQFKLQSYTPPENFQSRNQSSKNVASSGVDVEVINFGIAKFIEFEIKFITSDLGIADGYVIEKDAQGLENARAFLQYVTELNEFEFIPDRDSPGTFYRVLVESMPEFGDGTGYRLRELFSQNLRDVYETGIMKLRVIE